MKFTTGLVALGAACSIVLLTSPFALATDAKQDAADEPKHIIVTVKAGDTLSAIAEKYKTTYVRIFNANKSITNPDLIDVGQKIRIPEAKEKLEDRFSSQAPQAAPSATYTPATYFAPTNQSTPIYRGSTSGNTYVWGQCTWYVKNRRADLPNMLGNGGSWVQNAAARGYATGTAPRAGAVAEIPGHVMYVESVNGNGTVNISEMNYNGGVGVVNYRTIPAGSARYIY